MSSFRKILWLSGTLAVMALGWFAFQSSGAAAPPPSAMELGDGLYENGDLAAAKTKYQSFVIANHESPDPDVQDQVAVARLRLGYVAAKEENFEEAREVLLEAADEYGGHGYSSEFGTLPDQAKYQAAVCLIADGKEAEAEQAFEHFIKENGKSPLAHAAFRRLVRLNNGKAKPEHEELIQAAVSEREAYIRRQQALCGPKAVLEIIKRHKMPIVELDELAKQCSMDDDKGTTITGMIAGLKANGLVGTGLKLAYRDLEGLPLPAIWLENRHYLVILEEVGQVLTVYDPADDTISNREITAEDSGELTLDVIKITKNREGRDA